jgi:hypothetical protein
MSNKLLEIQEAINSLSLDDKKYLLKRLTKQLNADFTDTLRDAEFKNQLEMMAKDEQIQTEINLINQEFLTTEMDGIEEI